MTDSAAQRLNMVESQIRPSDITDRRILRAMSALPREKFVPRSLASLAYMDEAVALTDQPGMRAGAERRMLPPRTLAKLVQLARIEPADRVLVVGAGRGYGAALLSEIAATVVALESDSALAEAAKTNLAGAANVTVVTGALPNGASERGPYDVILVEGAVTGQPDTLLSQLKPGGRLAGVLATGATGEACLWRRVGSEFGSSTAFEASVAILPGFERTAGFVF